MEISANSYTNYYGYATYLNKDNLYLNMSQANQVTAQEDKQNQEQNVQKVVEEQKLTNEQTVAVYYNYQNNQAMKQRMEIMIDDQNEEEESTLSYQEIHDLQTQKNRNEILDNYSNNLDKRGNEVSMRV